MRQGGGRPGRFWGRPGLQEPGRRAGGELRTAPAETLRAAHAVALTGEPAGTVVTRTAGLFTFRATLEWDWEVLPAPSCLPAPDASFRHDLRETLSAGGTRLEVRGTVRALTQGALVAALERVARRTADAAGVSGAVLRMRVLKEEPPRSVRPDLVGALAGDLWRAGFAVRFAPYWGHIDPRGPAVGAFGDEERLRAFLGDHPAWRPA